MAIILVCQSGKFKPEKIVEVENLQQNVCFCSVTVENRDDLGARLEFPILFLVPENTYIMEGEYVILGMCSWFRIR